MTALAVKHLIISQVVNTTRSNSCRRRCCLVTCVADGKPEAVRYEAVNAMLLNEFLKEHRKNEEQQATIAQLKSGLEALTATVKEQAAQIQKVSAQLEANKPTPQVVANDQ